MSRATPPSFSTSTPDQRRPTPSPEDRRRLARELTAWAVRYPELRAELLADPAAVAARELAVSEKALDVRVLEESDDLCFLPLPAPGDAPRSGEADELTLLLDRAAGEPELRRALLEDPRSVLAAELDMSPPADLRLEVVEAAAGEILVVLPPATRERDVPASFSERELASLEAPLVAGNTPTSIFVCFL